MHLTTAEGNVASQWCTCSIDAAKFMSQSQHTVIAAGLFSGQLYNQGLIKWRRQRTEAPWNEHLPNRNCARCQPRERSATRWSPAGLWWPRQSERPRVNESTLHKPRTVDCEGVSCAWSFVFPERVGEKGEILIFAQTLKRIIFNKLQRAHSREALEVNKKWSKSRAVARGWKPIKYREVQLNLF